MESSTGVARGVADDATGDRTSPAVDELGGLVLVIRKSPSGLIVHDWRRAEEFDILQYRRQLHAEKIEGHIIFVSAARQRDCDEENRQCVKDCMSTPLPRGFGHITAPGRGKGGKQAYCERRCAQPYADCAEAQGRRVEEFSTTDRAVDWLKRHHEEVLVGSIVIIAGVAFVTVVSGGGGLILIPALLLAAS
jgi:hypothetical protein